MARPDRRRTQRSSVADLRILYANQMQTLHAECEGSAQLVPTIPGRHIVFEQDSLLMLNPATYKVESTVRLILLDDIVLLARRRQRRAAGRPSYVADLAWPLNQILVLDTKDSACEFGDPILLTFVNFDASKHSATYSNSGLVAILECYVLKLLATRRVCLYNFVKLQRNWLQGNSRNVRIYTNAEKVSGDLGGRT